MGGGQGLAGDAAPVRHRLGHYPARLWHPRLHGSTHNLPPAAGGRKPHPPPPARPPSTTGNVDPRSVWRSLL